MVAILGTSNVIGAIATYNLEHALRTNFLETRLLNELAQRDGLTGLYNRRIFDDYIKRIWRQSRRESVSIEIIFVANLRRFPEGQAAQGVLLARNQKTANRRRRHQALVFVDQKHVGQVGQKILVAA